MKKITDTDITAITGSLFTSLIILFFIFTISQELDNIANKAIRKFPVKYEKVSDKNSNTIKKLLVPSIKNCKAK